MDHRSATFGKSRCCCYGYVCGRLRAKKSLPELVQPPGRNAELKHIRVSLIVLRWILAVSLTALPVLAESPPQSGEAQARQREALNDAVVSATRQAVRVVDDNNDPVVGSSIFSAVLMDSPAASSGQPAASSGQIDTQKKGTELGAPKPAGNPDRKKAEPGGKTMSDLLIAALIAGGVIALILLLRGDDHKGATAVATPPSSHGVTPPPQEGGTVLVPGKPSVSSPH